MNLVNKYSFRFSVIAAIISILFVLMCVCLFPSILKNALLESPKAYMQTSSDFFIECLENGHTDHISQSLNTSKNLRVIILSSDMYVITDTSAEDNLSGKIMILPGTDRALAGESVFTSSREDNAFIYGLLCAFEENGEEKLLYLYSTDTHTYQVYKNCTQAGVISGILLISVPVILLMVLIGNLSAKLRKLSTAVRQLTNGKYTPDFLLSGYDELCNISSILNEYSLRQAKNDELRRTFVSDASHELKTPLAAVKLLSDTILLTPQMSREDTKEFLTDISNEIDRLTRICSRLLQITKYDTFSDSTELVPLDLAVVAENVSRMLFQPANNAGLEIRCEFQDDCIVLANYDLVFQIFYNLIENAIKYGADGKEVRVFLYKKDGTVIFIVDDDGTGIPESDLERIFDRFYRVDKARARATGGTGLGLSIVETAVHSCNGTVEAHNRHPHGARFIVKFPVFTDTPEENNRGEQE